MQKLNLPECDLKIKQEEGNQFIFDIVRKKYVALTPEEWVRQHFIHLMINHLKYPKSLISIEFSIQYFKSGKRSDILLNDRNGHPFLLVECKAPDVSLDGKAIPQIASYNKIIKAPYISLTNGIHHFIWKLNKKKYQTQSQFPEFPDQST